MASTPAPISDFRTGARWVLLILAVLLLPGPSAWGQDREARREEYLDALGLTEERQSVLDYLDEILPSIGELETARLSALFSFVMVIHGLDRQLVERLRAGGVDVVHAMTSNARPFIEQGLFSDPVVLADVSRLYNDDLPGDGYGSTIELRVVETYKGTAAPDTIYVRQRGRFGEGEIGPLELEPTPGERYLLLLSRPMYEFFYSTRDPGGPSGPADALPPPPAGYYAVYRYYRVDDGRVIMGDGSSSEADHVFQELRWLQELTERL